MKKSLALVLTVVMIAMSAGCGAKKVIVNTPPGIDAAQVAQWYQATGAMESVSEFAKQAPPILLSLHQAGAIDDEYYIAALKLTRQFDQGGQDVTDVLKKSPNNFSAPVKVQVFSKIQDLLTALQTFNSQGGTHIKNPNAMAEFSALVASAKLALTLTQNLSGN